MKTLFFDIFSPEKGDMENQCLGLKERRPIRTSNEKEKANPKGGFPYSPPMGQQRNLYEGGKP